VASADAVTDVVSLEMANASNATVMPVAIRASDLMVRGAVPPRPVTIQLKQVNAAQPYLQCTIAAGESGCESEGAAAIPAGTKLILGVAVPAGPGTVSAMPLAIGWRAAPTG
jgi:hypothetical protein